MTKIGFDNQKYLELQSKKILERVEQFGGHSLTQHRLMPQHR